MQRADLTAIEEVMALAELIDAELTMAFGDEYRALAKIDEPKWRVKALLTAIESDRKNATEYVSNKFVAETDSVFTGLPKPKDRTAFVNHDLPLLFTADEVQVARHVAAEHGLKHLPSNWAKFCPFVARHVALEHGLKPATSAKFCGSEGALQGMLRWNMG